MRLHDWTERGGWDGMHHLWITELLRWVKPRLPEGYHAYIGTVPLLAVGAPGTRPHVAVHEWREPGSPSETRDGAAAKPAELEPDTEVAVAAIDPGRALFVESHGRLVAAVELISPRNKDSPVSRTAYLSRYLGYLLEGRRPMPTWTDLTWSAASPLWFATAIGDR